MAKLLIVDDEEKIRTLIKKYAVFEGYEVVEAANGFEAIAKCASMRFDLILMDIMMPEMNGYEAAKAIRAMNDRPDGKNIPIIAMTANSFAEDVQASLDAGMNAHLSKPIVIEEVIKTILRYVHND